MAKKLSRPPELTSTPARPLPNPNFELQGSFENVSPILHLPPIQRAKSLVPIATSNLSLKRSKSMIPQLKKPVQPLSKAKITNGCEVKQQSVPIKGNAPLQVITNKGPSKLILSSKAVPQDASKDPVPAPLKVLNQKSTTVTSNNEIASQDTSGSSDPAPVEDNFGQEPTTMVSNKKESIPDSCRKPADDIFKDRTSYIPSAWDLPKKQKKTLSLKKNSCTSQCTKDVSLARPHDKILEDISEQVDNGESRSLEQSKLKDRRKTYVKSRAVMNGESEKTTVDLMNHFEKHDKSDSEPILSQNSTKQEVEQQLSTESSSLGPPKTRTKKRPVAKEHEEYDKSDTEPVLSQKSTKQAVETQLSTESSSQGPPKTRTKKRPVAEHKEHDHQSVVSQKNTKQAVETQLSTESSSLGPPKTRTKKGPVAKEHEGQDENYSEPALSQKSTNQAVEKQLSAESSSQGLPKKRTKKQPVEEREEHDHQPVVSQKNTKQAVETQSVNESSSQGLSKTRNKKRCITEENEKSDSEPVLLQKRSNQAVEKQSLTESSSLGLPKTRTKKRRITEERENPENEPVLSQQSTKQASEKEMSPVSIFHGSSKTRTKKRPIAERNVNCVHTSEENVTSGVELTITQQKKQAAQEELCCVSNSQGPSKARIKKRRIAEETEDCAQHFEESELVSTNPTVKATSTSKTHVSPKKRERKPPKKLIEENVASNFQAQPKTETKQRGRKKKNSSEPKIMEATISKQAATSKESNKSEKVSIKSNNLPGNTVVENHMETCRKPVTKQDSRVTSGPEVAVRGSKRRISEDAVSSTGIEIQTEQHRRRATTAEPDLRTNQDPHRRRSVSRDREEKMREDVYKFLGYGGTAVDFPFPGVKQCNLLMIKRTLAIGKYIMDPGSTINHLSNHTSIQVVKGKVKVRLLDKTRQVSFDDPVNVFVIPKGCSSFSIKNQGNEFAELLYTKFKLLINTNL